MRKSNRPATDIPPEEVCAPDAKLAITTQETQPIGEYIRQLGIVLRCVSDAFDAAHQDHDQEETKQGTSHELDEDWEGNLDQISHALKSKNSALIGAYLRDAGDVLSRLAPLLDPSKEKGWHLKFARKCRGRPTDNTSRIINNSNRRLKLLLATREYGKQEAAIEFPQGKAGHESGIAAQSEETKIAAD